MSQKYVPFRNVFVFHPGTTLSPPRMQEGAYQPGLLQCCSPLVKKCYGCGQMLKIRRGNDSFLQIPPPPNDLVIITATRRQYWQNGVQKRGQFHCTVNCVKSMQPTFIPFLVVIPSGLHPHLQVAHKQHIAKELQIS